MLVSRESLIFRRWPVTMEASAAHCCATVLHAAFMASPPVQSDSLSTGVGELLFFFLLPKPEATRESLSYKSSVHLLLWNIWSGFRLFLRRIQNPFLQISCSLLNPCAVSMNYAGCLFCSCCEIWDRNPNFSFFFYYRYTAEYNRLAALSHCRCNGAAEELRL